jgi:hypothetical protein
LAYTTRQTGKLFHVLFGVCIAINRPRVAQRLIIEYIKEGIAMTGQRIGYIGSSVTMSGAAGDELLKP